MKLSILMFSGLVTMSAFADVPITCDIYSNQSIKYKNEIENFDKLVVEPLKMEKIRLEKEYSRETAYPLAVEQKNLERQKAIRELGSDNQRRTGLIAANEKTITDIEARLPEMGTKLEGLRTLRTQKNNEKVEALKVGDKLKAKAIEKEIDSIEKQIETAKHELAKAKSQKADLEKDNSEMNKKKIRDEAEITRMQTAIESSQEEVRVILTTAPSADELRGAINSVNFKLADTVNLRNEKNQDYRLAVNAYNLCVEVDRLRTDNEYLRRENDILRNTRQ